jgi:hypothetical protein
MQKEIFVAACEFADSCKVFAQADDSVKKEYCDGNFLHCACYMVAAGKGVDAIPADMSPEDKAAAYALIADA